MKTNEALPYKFDDKNRQIVFSRHDLPSPWINYLSNGRLHAFVSQAGGGMLWWKTPMNFRITRYRFYNLPIDSPGFYIYIRMKDGTVWSPTFRPCNVKPDEWSAAHAPGYSRFVAQKAGLNAILTLFMSPDYDALVWNLQLENKTGNPIDCDVFAYAELSEFSYMNEVILGYYLKWQVAAEFDKELNAITYRFNSFVQIREDQSPVVYFSSSQDVDSYCCNRDLFCGNYRDERDPEQVENGVLSNSDMFGGEPCAALHNHVSLASSGTHTVNYFLGVTPGALVDWEKARAITKDTLSELKSDGMVDAQLKKNIAWWNEHLGVYACDIPDETAMRQVNIWNPVQSVVTARFSRSISSMASGVRGIGYRDSAQDMLAQAYRKPDWANSMLCYLASQQFEDGSTVHQSWPEDNKPPQVATRSDNHLWIVYLAYAIAAESGDLRFLDTQIPFLDKDLKTPVNADSLWAHLVRGVEFTENNLGEHGLPLILFSDWNDHLGPFGRKGKGESVFVSQQYIYALKQLIELAELRGDNACEKKLNTFLTKQQHALESFGWDGEWYLRGYDDDGEPIGTHDAEYARIWVNTQSWNVIAGEGSRDHNVRAMDSVKSRLDTGLGLLINHPSLPSDKANGLPAGYSENGGVFCQANCWAIIAEALLGRGDTAWRYYKQIMPDEVIKKIGLDNYRNEAYAYSSTMLGPSNDKFGWACVSQVTGTAAWMDVAVTQYLLGIRPILKGLLMDPCVPSDWKNFKVTRKYRGCELEIEVDTNGVQHGVKSVSVNGKVLDGNLISQDIIKGQSKATVKVVMG